MIRAGAVEAEVERLRGGLVVVVVIIGRALVDAVLYVVDQALGVAGELVLWLGVELAG